MTTEPVWTDPSSGALVCAIGADRKPADNIYGEQPYTDATGRWIAIRYYACDDHPGGLSIVDLRDGSRHDVLVGDPRFPAFHAWGEYLYYQQTIGERLLLRRCRYDALETEDVAELPPEMGAFSYGAVSPDHRYYAVSVIPTNARAAKVYLLDLQTAEWRLLLDRPCYHAKHEQFSRDGRNNVLIQLNEVPDVRRVLLASIDTTGSARLFSADRPHTPRPTGHEAWIGTSDRVLFSSATDPHSAGNVWAARADGGPAELVCPCEPRFGHISVSRCGRYWIGDTSEAGTPVYVGRFGSRTCRPLVTSNTIDDGNQWSHTHPYLTADNRWMVFTSSRSGHPQVYGARIHQGWLDTL